MAKTTFKSKRMSQQQRYNAAKKAGMSDEKALYESTKKTTIKATEKKPAVKKSAGKPTEAGLIKKTGRKLREIFYGKKTYAGKKVTPSLHKKYAGSSHNSHSKKSGY